MIRHFDSPRNHVSVNDATSSIDGDLGNLAAVDAVQVVEGELVVDQINVLLLALH